VGAVNDFAHVIPLDQAQSLENYLDDFQSKTGSAIVVVTLASANGDVDGAAADLFKAWGIGQKGKDNGVLILAAIKDRRARIEVGYGLEGVITDGQAGDILRQQVYPLFKQEQYGACSRPAYRARSKRPNTGSKPGGSGRQRGQLGEDRPLHHPFHRHRFFQ
jgi:uncharacterized protein